MLRQVIQIDEEKCNGCGICANACHEGAIDIIDGKAKLVRENFCDGFGDCLSSCPTGAISFITKDALEYDEEEVKKAKAKKLNHDGCLRNHITTFNHNINFSKKENDTNESRLSQWPVQIKLVPENAPFFEGAKLLIAADCTAYAYANMHEEFMKGRMTIIGCPKLDNVDYTEKTN